MPPVTLKAIAAETGFSVSTIASILRGDPKLFPPATCAIVRSAAHRLGYRPNLSARAVRRGRTGIVTLLQGHDPARTYLQSDLLAGIEEALATDDSHLMLARYEDDVREDGSWSPRAHPQLSSDGLLIGYHSAPPQPLLDLIGSMPAVWLNARLPSNSLHPDDHGAAMSGVDHLIALGHRRIAYVNTWWPLEAPRTVHYSAHDRISGYLAAMARAGLPPRCVGAQQGLGSLAILSALCSGDQRPTALITYDPSMALEWIHVLALNGLTVPQDGSVMSFAEGPLVLLGVSLTSYVAPWRWLGSAAVAMLRQCMLSPTLQQPTVSQPFRLQAGGSCGPPPP